MRKYAIVNDEVVDILSKIDMSTHSLELRCDGIDIIDNIDKRFAFRFYVGETIKLEYGEYVLKNITIPNAHSLKITNISFSAKSKYDIMNLRMSILVNLGKDGKGGITIHDVSIPDFLSFINDKFINNHKIPPLNMQDILNIVQPVFSVAINNTYDHDTIRDIIYVHK